MKKILFLLLLILGMGASWGQLASWELTSDGAPNNVNANISAGDFTGGSGISSITFMSKGAWADHWRTQSSAGVNDWFQVSLTPNSGYSINVTDINFGERRSAAGIRKYKVEWSLDPNFGSGNYTVLATVSVPDNTSERDGSLSNLNIDVSDGETVYIRWYGYRSESKYGTWRINDGTLNIEGSITAVSANDTDSVATNGTQPTAATISSIDNDDSNNPVNVFQMNISDLGTADGLPTKVTNIRLKPYSTNTASWTDNIQGFVVDDGTNTITPASVNITDTYIDFTFNVGDLNIADGTTTTLSFAVYLNTFNIEDGKILSFMVDADDHGFTADSSGSTFAATFSGGDFNSNDFTIGVVGTELRFIQQPTDVAGNTAMSPAVTVEITDANGNREMDYETANIGLTTTGSFDSAATISSQIDAAGIATFNNLIFNVAGLGLTFTANDSDGYGWSSATSNTFDVTGAPEISVEGNSTEITSGDTTPDTADHTDFGDVNYQDGSSVTYTFTIKNTGNVNLDLTDASPYISITGDTGDFTLDVNPSSPIAANSSTSFDIKFDPTTYGTRTAHISIANNDSDENPYTFDVTGNGISTDEVDWAQLNTADGNIRSGENVDVYTEIYESGVTGDGDNNGDGFKVWIGYSASDATNTSDFESSNWTWVPATYNYNNGNNDGYMAQIGSSLAAGTYYFVSRIQINGGPYKYGGYKSGGGNFWDGNDYVSGILTVDIVDWCNLENPSSGTQVLGGIFNVDAEIWEDGLTNAAGQGDHIQVWIGYSTTDATNVSDFETANWTWVPATYDNDDGNNDKYTANILDSGNGGITSADTYYYASRFQINSGPYSYGGTNTDGNGGGSFWDGTNYISGVLTVLNPQEIDITGNSVSISNGDTTPSPIDNTDLGAVRVDGGAVSYTYKIYNLGDVDLNLTGTPKVSISGTNASDFTITANPSSPVAAGGSSTFTITFDPSDYGIRTATISIDNNDDDKNPYTFDIQGTGADYTDCIGIYYFQDFETTPAQKNWIYTQTQYIHKSSNISASLYPTGENLYVSGSDALYINNHPGTVELETVDTRGYSDIEFSLRVASFSGTSTNGADAYSTANNTGDHVEISVSEDDGNTWSEELEVTGKSNARWSFTTGTGIAKAIYDGNDTKTTFHPASGGDRTTDGYSTMVLTGLPSVEKLKIKIWIKNNSSKEYWVIDDAKLTGHKATIWSAGAWTNGAPDEFTKLIINDDYNTTNGNIHTCECEVKSGKTLTISDGTNMLVESNINNDGTIVVSNEGSLVQHQSDASLTGSGTYQLDKTSQPLDHYYDYVYWSSPLNSASFTLGDIIANAWGYYKFDPNQAGNGHTYPGWVQLSATDKPDKGVGYAISAPTGTNAGTTLTAHFVKGNDPFNNGDITVPILMKGGPANVGDYNLLGNPYPSAIDFNALSADSDNNKMEAAYSLWTNCAGLNGNAHQDSGYTTYSVSGTNTAACSGNGGTAQAGQYIATGQGFMVKANDDNSTVTFKNSFRVTGNNNGFLNRSNNRNIAWIDMTGDTGKFSQIAIGFYPEATDAYDRNYDAHSMNTGSGFALYSLVNDEKLAIQGLAQLNGDEKVVSLGVESDAERMVTMHLNRIEGLSDVYIYLQDLDLNVIHDLTATDYTTTLHENQSDDRFKLIFTRQALNQKELEIDPNTVLLIQNDGVFNLKAQDHHMITALMVFDVNGRVLYKRRDLHSNFYKLGLKQVATGNLLLFKIELDRKNYLVKKALKK